MTSTSTAITIPLTVIFTPPPACATLNLTALVAQASNQASYSDFGYIYQDYAWWNALPSLTPYPQDPSASLTCYPPNYQFTSSYSPGLYCPSGWTSYAKTDGSAAPTSTFTKICCPRHVLSFISIMSTFAKFCQRFLE
jgi:hypothetical protein